MKQRAQVRAWSGHKISPFAAVRHRDKALAAYRRTRALELRAEGGGYAEIAREVGYANKGTAHKVIAEALEARESRTSTSCARSLTCGSKPCTRRCGQPPRRVTSGGDGLADGMRVSP